MNSLKRQSVAFDEDYEVYVVNRKYIRIRKDDTKVLPAIKCNKHWQKVTEDEQFKKYNIDKQLK